jgi:hypothetical protein
MECGDKIKNRCKKVYAKCVAYESEVPSFSELTGESCLDIEQVADDLYETVGTIKEEIDLTDLTNNCLTLPGTPTVKNVIQLLINTICAQQTTIQGLQSTLTTVNQQISDLQENICP